MGLTTTAWLASALNLLQIAYLGNLMRRSDDIELNRGSGVQAGERSPRARVLVIAFVIGFVALALEMVFARAAIMYFTANNYVFPVVVACYLILMALGNNMAGRMLQQGMDARLLFTRATLVAVATILLSLALPSILTFSGISLEIFKVSQAEFLLGGGTFMIASPITLSVLLMMPVAAISAMFPIFVHVITRDRERLGENVASTYFVQTIGNVVGAAATGFLILPAVGAVVTLQLCAAAIVVCAAAFIGRMDIRVVGAVGIVAFSFLVTPATFYSNATYGGQKPSRFSEEIEGIALKYDSSTGTAINIGAERSTSFNTVQNISAPLEDTIPLYEAVTGNKIERALIIGIGTARLALQIRHRNPQAQIVVVELLDVVIREMLERGSPAIRELLQASEVHVTDGRRYVEKYALPKGERFDLIQVGVFHVTSSGAGGLFTTEFQRHLRQLLTPKGVLTYNAYLPAVRAGFEAFETGIVFSRELGRQVSEAMFFNDDAADVEGGLLRYRAVLAAMQFSEAPHLMTTIPDWYFSADDPRYFMLGSGAMTAMLTRVARQTDDLPATEFFLTRTTTWPIPGAYSTTRLDPRYWENIDGYALDGSDGSRDITATAGVTREGPETAYDLPEPAIVRGYDLRGEYGMARPSSWTLEASNDGQTWRQIHRVDDFDDWEGVAGGRYYPRYGRVFWFDNSEPFTRYRIRFDETADLQIRMFENSLFGHGGRAHQ